MSVNLDSIAKVSNLSVRAKGRLPADGIIEFPQAWANKVKKPVTIILTPYKTYQQLYVESVQYGRRAVVRNALGGTIQGWYFLVANLKDGEEIDPEMGNYSNTTAFE
tara:strand:+ start:47 stop:367 length:321 start_codon:yes stop_codon:yes gene_type:complete